MRTENEELTARTMWWALDHSEMTATGISVPLPPVPALEAIIVSVEFSRPCPTCKTAPCCYEVTP